VISVQMKRGEMQAVEVLKSSRRDVGTV